MHLVVSQLSSDKMACFSSVSLSIDPLVEIAVLEESQSKNRGVLKN